ncbi:beta-ketoacyl-[acyl-carrier-protein] synthase family protein [Nitrospira sp. NS4]|uniref:beta-ketoacyl-[acyl-carrier-protein] synthase family protein n=1 Tax=Nitrospira sp. NS4 TaxID=3414498 RepID=UPI003C2F43EB
MSPDMRPMMPLTLTAYTLVTANGRGVGPVLQALRDRRSGLRPCDFEDVTLKTYIGRVEGLEDFSLENDLERFDCRNNRLAWLGLQQDGFMVAVAEAKQRYGAHRVAVVMGTSTSGILETEHAYHMRDQAGSLPAWYTSRYRYTHNMFSLGHFVRTCLGLRGPAMVVSTACSSSAKVFATVDRLLRTGLCDAAIVGGVDSLCLTTLYGFSALQLLSTKPCRPCDEDREGLSLGEAAGFALLESSERVGRPGAVALLGYGESTDGYHMSHPHPEGAGAIRAIRDSLARAGLRPEDVEYINLHGTATRANDAVEDKAVYSIFGARPACSSTKGWTGHTLGAAGITEAVISTLCLTHGLIPGTLNCARVDPSLKSRILRNNQTGPLAVVLSNIFGFGGNNCSLVLGKLP